jgi:hypothetical protein
VPGWKVGEKKYGDDLKRSIDANDVQRGELGQLKAMHDAPVEEVRKLKEELQRITTTTPLCRETRQAVSAEGEEREAAL